MESMLTTHPRCDNISSNDGIAVISFDLSPTFFCPSTKCCDADHTLTTSISVEGSDWDKGQVLTGGADFQQMSAKISDMQLVETMHWGVESIARIYGVPLQLLQYPEATSHAQSEVLMQSWLRVGLGPMVTRIEAGLQRLIVGQTTFVKFNIDGLLRPMTKERYDAYAVALNNGFLSLDEVRALEDRAPLPVGGDEFWKPLNIGTVGKEPDA